MHIDPRCHITHQRVNSDRRKFELQGLALQAGRFKHILDQSRQAVGFFVDNIKEFTPGGFIPHRILAQEAGAVPLDKAQRCAKFM